MKLESLHPKKHNQTNGDRHSWFEVLVGSALAIAVMILIVFVGFIWR